MQLIKTQIMKIKNLKKRIESLDASDVCELMKFNKEDTSFKNNKEARNMLNQSLISKFELGKIDEIELIIIESGN